MASIIDLQNGSNHPAQRWSSATIKRAPIKIGLNFKKKLRFQKLFTYLRMLIFWGALAVPIVWEALTLKSLLLWIKTSNLTSASQGLDSNFRGKSSLEPLMPSSRQGEFWNSITCLAYLTSRRVGESKKDSWFDFSTIDIYNISSMLPLIRLFITVPIDLVHATIQNFDHATIQNYDHVC